MEHLDDPKLSFLHAELSFCMCRCPMMLEPHIPLVQCPSCVHLNWEQNKVELWVSWFGKMAEYRIFFLPGPRNVSPMSCWVKMLGFLPTRWMAGCAKMAMAVEHRYGDHSQDKPLNGVPRCCRTSLGCMRDYVQLHPSGVAQNLPLSTMTECHAPTFET